MNGLVAGVPHYHVLSCLVRRQLHRNIEFFTFGMRRDDEVLVRSYCIPAGKLAGPVVQYEETKYNIPAHSVIFWF